MEIEISFFSVLAAGIASFVVGFFWYSPFLFGKLWMKLKNCSPDDMKNQAKDMGKYYGMTFVVSLITAYVLAHVMNLSEAFFAYPPLTTAISTAFWMWLGFIFPTQFTATIFGEKNWKLLGVDTGYQLVGLMTMGITFALVGF